MSDEGTRKITIGLIAATIFTCCFYVLADSSDKILFPAEYYKWTHVKSTLIGPQSKGFAVNGGLHHFWANEKAVEGYQVGKFPDGAVVVDERLKTDERDGVIHEGPRQSLAVMVKDQQRYAETGGWGFEVFVEGNQAAGVLTPQAKTGCFNCHSQQKSRDFVFSKLRK